MGKMGEAGRRYVIVVDGPSGVGKSTVAKILAEATGYCCLDTGALYRTVAWRALSRDISLYDESGLVGLCNGITMIREEVSGKIRIQADGEEIGDQIRSEDMGMAASLVSRFPGVRRALLHLQRKAGESGGIIAEGRDMGTVVFPDADIKIFLDAEPAERARRRLLELVDRGEKVDYEDVLNDIILRDEQDRNRTAAPLKPAPDAVVLDTTHLTIGEVVDALVNIVRSKVDQMRDSSL